MYGSLLQAVVEGFDPGGHAEATVSRGLEAGE